MHSDVVGSLLRPTYLLEAQQRRAAGELTAAQFKQVEDRAVTEAVALQEQAGLDVVTDGEMRRYAFYGHLIEAIEGFDKLGGWGITFRDDEGHEARLQRPVVVSKLQWRRQMSVEEFTWLRGRTTKPVKVTLLSAQQASAYYDPEKSRAAYPTRDAFLADLVDFTRREIAELGRLGCEVRPDRRAAVRRPARRDDARRLSAARERSGPDARRVHRAGQRDHRRSPGHDVRHPHLPRQPQEHVLRVRRLRSDRRADLQPLALPSVSPRYDDERSGMFEPLRHVPDDWIVVLGLVSSKRAELEQAATLRARIAEAAAIVPLERLALSPQCGFASTHEGNRLTPEDQRKKLELVARVAAEVWA